MGGAISNKRSKQISQSDYSLGSIVGIGGFGTLWEVKNKLTNDYYVMKQFNLVKMSIKDVEVIHNEINSLKRINKHPFIIKLYHAFRDNTTVSLILDLQSGGDLRLALRSGEYFTESKVAYIIGCIGSALQFLHLHGVIHRDVKPENIVFSSNGQPKLVDFGMSYQIPSQLNICICQSKSGTKEYLAPEVFVPSHHHSFESDFWSLGVVMYEVLFRKRPYDNIIPISFVKYSLTTYQSVWESMVQIQRTQTLNLSVDSISGTTFTTLLSTPTNQNNNAVIGSFESEKLKSVNMNTISIYRDFNSFIHTIIPPLDSDYFFNIPATNAYNQTTTNQCKDLLLNLLNVQIHQRYGVASHFNDFKYHSFFELYNYQLDTIHQISSPYTPDPTRVGFQLWHQFSQLSHDQKTNSNCQLTHCVVSKEVNMRVGSIQYSASSS